MIHSMPVAKNRGVDKPLSMSVKIEVIEIEDSSPPPVRKRNALRPVACVRREDVKEFEKEEDCFILEFDPSNDLEMAKLPWNENDGSAEADLIVVGERGKVACRDYPHPRNTCAKFPFENTSHHIHCKLCYCYVCDSSAPCPNWTGSSGHCHAFNNEAWNKERQTKRLVTKPPQL